MNKFHPFLGFIFFLCSMTFAQNQTWTLEDCVKRAIEENISIKQSELDYANAELDKLGAFASFFPSVSANANHSWNIGLNQNITTGLLENVTTQFSSMSVGMGLDIYNGLQNINRLHRANLSLLARQYQLADIADNVSLLVANAYLQVMFNREILGVQKAQLEVSKEELERTQQLIQAGALTRRDIFEIEANIATQEQALIQAENAYRLTKINLAQLLMITDYENFEIANEDFEVPLSQILNETPKDIFEKSLTLRNDIKLSVTNLEIAEKDVELSKGALQPSIGAFYSYSTRISYSDRIRGTGEFSEIPIGYVAGTGQVVNTQIEGREVIGPLPIADQLGLNDGHNFGIQLSIPIFNGFSLKNNVKRNKINVERAKNQLEQQKLDLESTINQAYNDALGAFTFFEAAQKTVRARKDAYDNAQDSYAAGVTNAFEYAQIKQRYESAVSDQVRAKFDYIFKLKVLEFYFGVKLEI